MLWVYNASLELNAKSEYPAIIAVSLSLTVLMTILVALRAYVRAIVVESPGSDDYVTFFSAVSTRRITPGHSSSRDIDYQHHLQHSCDLSDPLGLGVTFVASTAG